MIDNILVDPSNPRQLVVGAWVISDLSHPDGGLYISEDGGATWTSEPDMQGQSIRALATAPSDPKIFVAGSIAGVFRSKDSGVHWERISPKENAEIHEIESLAVDPTDPNVIYAGTWHLPWKTTDGGATWTNIKQGIIEDSDVFSIIVDPKQPNVVYASACSGIYKSENGGGEVCQGAGNSLDSAADARADAGSEPAGYGVCGNDRGALSHLGRGQDVDADNCAGCDCERCVCRSCELASMCCWRPIAAACW